MMSIEKTPQPNSTADQHRADAQHVLVDAGIAPLVIRLGYAAPYRVWVVAHAINAAAGGSGRVPAADLRAALRRYGVVMTDRRYQQLIAAGAGVFWTSTADRRRLSLTGAARAWLTLLERVPQDSRDSYRPALRRAIVDPSGTLAAFNARLYAAWVANHRRYELHAARATIGDIFGVSRGTLISWDKAAGVGIEPTYTVLAGDNLALIPRNPYSSTNEYRGDVHHVTDSAGRKAYLWRSANVYSAAVQLSRIGRQKHIRRRVKRLLTGVKRPPVTVGHTRIDEAWRAARRILRGGKVSRVKVWIGSHTGKRSTTRYYELIGAGVDISSTGAPIARDYPCADTSAILNLAKFFEHPIKTLRTGTRGTYSAMSAQRVGAACGRSAGTSHTPARAGDERRPAPRSTATPTSSAPAQQIDMGAPTLAWLERLAADMGATIRPDADQQHAAAGVQNPAGAGNSPTPRSTGTPQNSARAENSPTDTDERSSSTPPHTPPTLTPARSFQHAFTRAVDAITAAARYARRAGVEYDRRAAIKALNAAAAGDRSICIPTIDQHAAAAHAAAAQYRALAAAKANKGNTARRTTQARLIP